MPTYVWFQCPWYIGMRTAESNYQTQTTLITCFFFLSFWQFTSHLLKMFRRSRRVILSSSRTQTIFGGLRVWSCVFLPSLITDNDGRLMLNHLIFTARMSLTGTWWLMTRFRPHYPVIRNQLVEMCLFSKIHQTDEIWKGALGSFSCLFTSE